MDKYFQRSNDAILADKLMKCGQKLAVWLTDCCNLTTFHLIDYSDDGFCVDGVLQENLKWQSEFVSWATYRQAEFLLPTSDPAITLRDSLENAIKERKVLKHSLAQALNECDELRQKNENLNYDLEIFKSGNRTIMASNERLMVIIEELQSDLDTAKNDLTVADAAIEELKPVTLDPYIANQKLESQFKEQDRTISNLKDQIDGRDAALRGSVKTVQELNQEIERLRDVIDQNNKAFAQENERLLAVIEERYKKIEILLDNLNRADSDRLSELTSIMRMLQAWESVPIQKWGGALTLIKRVLFDAICKLDPSQAVES
jgi:predicted RNase H-like nuclease (RuvC/YqgF family)